MKTMAIHSEAVDILVRKSRFEPEVAIGIAEAMEVSINLSQLVTVPVLDSRLQELRHELKSEIQAIRLELDGRLTTEIAKVNGTIASEIGKVNASIAQTNTALADGLGRLSTEIQKANANMMRWVLLTMLGSTALNMAARSFLNMLSN